MSKSIQKLIQRNKELKAEISQINIELSRLNGAARDDFDKQLEEAYQRGLNDGKDSVSHECDGCLYNDGTKEHSLCHICSNAYINRWTAKPKADDEIKVGDEVISLDRKGKAIEGMSPWFVTYETEYTYQGFGAEGMLHSNSKESVRKTGRHFNIDKILKEMQQC